MTKKKTIEVKYCDFCGGADFPASCQCCGKDICDVCKDKNAVEYPHAVNFSGSDDGFYCKTCDTTLTKSGKDKRHTALLKIQALRTLRKESQVFYADFLARSRAAEAEVVKHKVPRD